jgi:hypothetical protein
MMDTEKVIDHMIAQVKVYFLSTLDEYEQIENEVPESVRKVVNEGLAILRDRTIDQRNGYSLEDAFAVHDAMVGLVALMCTCVTKAKTLQGVKKILAEKDQKEVLEALPAEVQKPVPRIPNDFLLDLKISLETSQDVNDFLARI